MVRTTPFSSWQHDAGLVARLGQQGGLSRHHRPDHQRTEEKHDRVRCEVVVIVVIEAIVTDVAAYVTLVITDGWGGIGGVSARVSD